jgi:serine/threonine protein kinase
MKENSDTAGSRDLLLLKPLDGKYRLEALVGQGASGQVYEATDLHLGRKVAVKLLHEHLLCDGKEIERFKQESILVSAFDHPGIVRVFSQGVLAGGQLYLVMEFAGGETLAKRLAREQTLEPESFFSIFEQILDGLGFAHKQGIVHRDIKPSNIMLAKQQDSIQARILDFGIAKKTGGSNLVQTTAGMPLGTSSYMSPEQCTSAAVDGRADLYSLACVMYEALTGASPFAGGSALEIMYKQVHKTITGSDRLWKIPRSFRDFFAKAMQKEPDKRFQSAEEMKQALLSLRQARTGKIKIGVVAAAVASALLLIGALAGGAGLLARLYPSGKSEEDPYRRDLSRLHDASDLRYFLYQNKRIPEPERIKISLRWLQSLPRSGRKELEILGRSQQALADYLDSSGRSAQAYQLYETMLKSPGLSHLQMAELKQRMGTTAVNCQEWVDAFNCFLEARGLNDGASTGLEASCYEGMSRCFLSLQSPADAEFFARQSVAIRKVKHNPDYFYAVLNLKDMLKHCCRQTEAEKLVQEACADLETIRLRDSGDYFFIKLQLILDMAEFAETHEQYQIAKEQYRKALDFIQAEQERNDKNLAYLNRQRATIYDRMGQPANAIGCRMEVLRQSTPGACFSSFAADRLALAWSYNRNGQNTHSLSEVKSLLSDWKRWAGGGCPFGPADFYQLSYTLELLRFFLEQEHCSSEYQAICLPVLAALSKAGWERSAWLIDQARYYHDQGSGPLSVSCYRQALACLPFQKGGTIARDLKTELAQELFQQKKFDEALAVINSVNGSELSAVNSGVQLSLLKRLAAQIAQARGDFARELKLRREALGLCAARNSSNYREMALLQADLAGTYLRTGRKQEAAAVLAEAMNLLLRADPAVSYSYARLGLSYLELGDYEAACRCLSGVTSGVDGVLKSMTGLPDRFQDNQVEAVRSFLTGMQSAALDHSDDETRKEVLDLTAKLIAGANRGRLPA